MAVRRILQKGLGVLLYILSYYYQTIPMMNLNLNLNLKITLVVIIVISIYVQIFQSTKNIFNNIIIIRDDEDEAVVSFATTPTTTTATTTTTTTTTTKTTITKTKYDNNQNQNHHLNLNNNNHSFSTPHNNLDNDNDNDDDQKNNETKKKNNIMKKKKTKPYRKIKILINNNTNTTPILSFIRIPKTGSTSMMSFLEKYSGLISLADVGEGKQYDCMFGNFSDLPGVDAGALEEKKAGCAHRKRPALQHDWDRIHSRYYMEYHIQHFSMIREPYNHMKSWFYYKKQFMYKTNNTMKNYNDIQLEHLTTGNFSGWLHNFHYVGLDKLSSFQYEFFGDNVDDALTYFQQHSHHNLPIVIPLINECYTGSMRYMEKIVPKNYYFKDGAIDDFLNSSQFHSRPTNYYNKGNNNKKGNKNNNNVTTILSLEEENYLKEKAKIWFKDEYKFYNTVVNIFKDLVLSSSSSNSGGGGDGDGGDGIIDFLSKLPEGSCNMLLDLENKNKKQNNK